jgi:hypothetical protein
MCGGSRRGLRLGGLRFRGCSRGVRRRRLGPRRSGAGLDEVEEAAADLLGVELQRLDPLLDGGGGAGGRHGAVALAEYGVPGEGVHQALHHGLPRALRRRPDAEREARGISAGGELVGGHGVEWGEAGRARSGRAMGEGRGILNRWRGVSGGGRGGASFQSRAPWQLLRWLQEREVRSMPPREGCTY